jgi:hypothetical protein
MLIFDNQWFCSYIDDDIGQQREAQEGHVDLDAEARLGFFILLNLICSIS